MSTTSKGRKNKMIELSVCIGSSCHIKGSYNVIQTFQQMIEENNLHGQVDFKGTFCMKQCDKPGVAVAIDNEKFNIEMCIRDRP